MKFNKLRVLGFKSFVEPTEFYIERGLTGVVGPNGCGKSNLVEALRWVMGENSYKNMRASGMDDVIFSGSGNRPSRNTAEVTLFLDNTDRTAPAQFNDADELQVSRRIERESGSVYRINGKDVRAKDVQLLFADASTGARSPSMVGQGRIGELISAKPQARRALLEEAAGISGLHSRRHEAELRLRAAETNLERLEDVVTQLDSQLDSLKRQARQAARYRNLSGDIRKTEALLFHLRWAGAKEVEVEAENALNAATVAVASAAEKQGKDATTQAVIAHKLPQLRDDEAAAAAGLQRLTIARQQIDEEIARIAERKAELEGRITQLDGDLEREERMISENADFLERLEAEEAELQNQSRNLAETEEKTKEVLEQTTLQLGESEKAFTDLTADLAEQNARKSQLVKTLQQANERKSRLDSQMQQVEHDLTKITADIAALAGPMEKQEAAEKLEAALATHEAQLEQAEALIVEKRQAEQSAREPLTVAQARVKEVETEARTLRNILNQGGQDLFPAIVEKIKVEAGYEAALGAALGEDLDVSTDASAPAHWGLIAGEGDQALPDGATPLASFVDAPAELARRLAQIGVATQESGNALQKLLKPGQRLVSVEGDLWRWDGYSAGAEAPTPAAQRLAQKNRLAELDKEFDLAIAALRSVEAAFETAKADAQSANDKQQQARETLRGVQRELGIAREEHAVAERAVSQFASRKSALEEAKNRLSADIEEMQVSLVEAETALAAVPDLGALNTELDGRRTKLAQDRAKLAEARANADGLSREAEARGRRLQAIIGERDNWNSRASNAKKQAATLRARHTKSSEDLAEIEKAPAEFESKRIALISQVEQAEMKRSDAADILARTESGLADADRIANASLSALSEAREKRGRTEERVDSSQERRVEIEARIREELDCHPADVLAITELDADAKLPEMVPTENKLEKLKSDRERLGAVNLRADTEQEEIQESRDNLVSERDDLIEAIHKLRLGIQSLNKEGRVRLLEAFDEVNEQFKRLFTHLFGGGTAELQLIESDDPLEAGLEIMARPPGKKPQTMTLLSGGEQALTAMALIFAVFLTNPAPICVLDEVDAPLDDHNVERFCNLMDEMSGATDTRFVIITHNPITMARMNRLFGVTMAERGV
ncbi:MAG: chromosome segregation protein SMC, partial [Rhizobiaceae bacterium]